MRSFFAIPSFAVAVLGCLAGSPQARAEPPALPRAAPSTSPSPTAPPAPAAPAALAGPANAESLLDGRLARGCVLAAWRASGLRPGGTAPHPPHAPPSPPAGPPAAPLPP